MASNRNIIVKIEKIMGCFVTFTPINIRTREGEAKISEATTDPQKVWQNLCSKVKINTVKAIAFVMNDAEFPSWAAAYSFRQKCYEYCQQNGIHFYYSSTLAFQISAGITKSKVAVEEGQEIMVIYCEGLALYGQSLIREGNHFRAINIHLANDPNFKKKFKEVYLKGCKPQKIILLRFGSGNFIQQVVKFFKDDNPIVLDVDAAAFNDFLVDKMHALMEKKVSNLDVPPQLQTTFAVKLDKEAIIYAGHESIFPFEKSVIVDVESGKAVSLYSQHIELVEKVKLATFSTKKVKVTLKIDSNGFYDFYAEPFDGNKLDEELLKLDIDDSVIPTVSRNMLYEKLELFLEKIIFLLFIFLKLVANKKSLIPLVCVTFSGCGKPAKDVYAEAPEFVVYDLMKLCSASTADSLAIDEDWGFSVLTENDSLSIAVETLDGIRQSTPDFLLVIILRNILTPFKKGHGKEMDQIEVRFSGVKPNEILKKNFEKDAELIKANLVFC